MNAGIDLGYSAVKAVAGEAGERRVTFPSVVGTPDKARFSLNGNTSIVLTTPHHVQVGQGAVVQSRFLRRREDRRWWSSDEWYDLFLAALTELTPATTVELRIVTGLPVAFFGDREEMKNRLLGTHRVQREGRHAQTFRVPRCHVIPQPFGTLLSVALNDQGRIVNRDLASGAVGIIDIGGKTTNLLSVYKLAEVSRETASIDVGAWDAIRAVRRWLDDHLPDLELRDHQIADAMIARRVRYYGEEMDITEVVEEALEPLAEQIRAEVTQLWNGGGGLDAILISGGGALLLGPSIRRHFRHARVVEEPIFANALGYWRFAQRLSR